MHRTKIGNLKCHVHLLRQQFAQTCRDGLGEAFSTQEMERIVAQEVGVYRERIYPPMVVLRLFVDQVLSADQACQDAVGRRLSQRVAEGQAACSLSSGPYCKARSRLALGLPQRLCKQLGRRLELSVPPQWRWQGRTVKLFDATTVSMPDTPQNQLAWPQSGRQQPGLGFPLARIGALVGLGSGAVIDYAVASTKGKSTGEQALLREVSHSLGEDDILLADALHSTWWTLQMMAGRGIDVVMPNDGRRKVDCERDHVVWWPKPKRAQWLSKEQYQQMPAGIWVREVGISGRVLVTTLLEPEQASACEIEALYAMRWNIEVDFRTLKAAMGMDVLRCKSPDMVQKEIAVYLLTYNLVRWTMACAAQLAQVPARALSFASTRRLIWTFAGHLRWGTYRDTAYLAATLLKSIARCVLPRRPDRIEPRAKKRRPKPLPLLTLPRDQARARILAQRALKVAP